MKKYETAIRVVLASPSDVDTERRITEEVVNSVNSVVGAEVGVVIQLSRWEDIPAALNVGGPQSHIDSELRIPECDLIVGVFGMRFGSGTEHEIRQALESWRRSQKPQVMLYFRKEGPLPRNTDEMEHWARILKFRTEIGSQALFKEYVGENDFREQLHADLNRSVIRHANRTQLSPPLGERVLFVAATAVPAIMRVEGITEMAGDVELSLWTPHESLPVTIDITLAVNANITNRVSGNGGLISSVRLVRAEESNPQTETLAVGRIISVGSIVFRSVTLTLARSGGPITLLIQGLRVNAFQLRRTMRAVSLLRLESHDSDIRILNSQQTIGIPFNSFSFSVRTASDEPLAGTMALKASGFNLGFDDAGVCSPTELTLLLEFRESIPAAFTTKSQEKDGDFGTRFRVEFSHVNEGMDLYVTLVNTVVGTTISAGAKLVKAVAVEQGRLVEMDSSYDGNSIPIRKLEVNNGDAVALWEWISDDPLSLSLSERVSFGVVVRCKPGTSPGICAVRGDLGLEGSQSLIGILTADPSAPIPRFAPSPTSTSVLAVYRDV
jgi:hypothetical protein